MKVLISDEVHEAGIKFLEEKNFDVVKNYSISQEDLKKEIKDYDAIIVRSRTKLTKEILEQALKLKVIGRAGVGLDNIDLEEAERLDIGVLNTPEAPSISVAELTIGLIISLLRHISIADQTMHCGEWCKSDYLGHTLNGKKIGLIGFGNIGQAVAKRVYCLGMKVGIYDVDIEVKKIAENLGYRIYRSVDELIQESQIISLHIPATVHTENTIDVRRLKMMKKNTILINTARGNLVDEKSLISALKNGEIGGAALDVYREEPLKNMELCRCEDNLILTPHIGSQTIETQEDASLMIAQKVAAFLEES
ncbi:MAG: 3-phosphoglycerate dehydrogenase [Candidatus Lokiarchaeota archaeon]|nr:3-phosphoglycerate dehydrogenase [Candidatus Lokiarchaeota archaeon]